MRAPPPGDGTETLPQGAIMTNPFDLTGQRALITGSTRGIGRAIAQAMMAAGAVAALGGRAAPSIG
jgi:gluconate 5-dehydrogenase